MTTQSSDNRAPFAEQIPILDKQHEGRTEAGQTLVEIRKLEGEVDEALQAWVHERLGRHLGKYAPQIERVEVRFSDVNGPKGGIDRCCIVHMTLSSLPAIVAEMQGSEDREAFDLAAGRAERALTRSMQKHGFSNKHKGRQRGPHGDADLDSVQLAQADLAETSAAQVRGPD